VSVPALRQPRTKCRPNVKYLGISSSYRVPSCSGQSMWHFMIKDMKLLSFKILYLNVGKLSAITNKIKLATEQKLVVAHPVKNYCVPKLRPSTLSSPSPIPTTVSRPVSPKTQFKIILPSTPKYSQLLLRFPD
jgi:hypothetical protein